jgi:hypothetical protein
MYNCLSLSRLISVNGSSILTNMEPQTHSRKLLLSDLSADLILEAEGNLRDLIQRAEQILDDLELTLNISAFSQRQYTVSRRCSTSQLHDSTSIFKPSSGPQHPELRRCQRYAELRDASQSIVEAQRLEMQCVKPRVVYIRKPAISDS